MSEPALLLEPGAARLVEAPLMREETLVPSGEKYRVELEPLGAMQRHKIDAVGAFLGRRVHHQ